jgi:hypothetical protein
VSDHDPPAPVRKSTVTELPRIVGLVHEPRPKPAAAPTVTELPRIEGPAAPPAPALAPSVDELSVDAELRGVKVRAGARGAGIAALQRVLIVLIVVAGAVAVVRSFATPEAPRRPDLGRCTEPPHTEGTEGTEGIERRCTRDGS